MAGCWIVYIGNKIMRCSECGAEFYKNNIDEETVCPACGEYMEGSCGYARQISNDTTMGYTTNMSPSSTYSLAKGGMSYV